jgi:hypothetical protein
MNLHVFLVISLGHLTRTFDAGPYHVKVRKRMGFPSFPDTSNDMMCFRRQYAKDKKSLYGRVQTGSGEAGQAAWGHGHAHREGPGIEQKCAQALGQPRAWCHGHAAHKPLRSESASRSRGFSESCAGLPRDISKKSAGYFARDPQEVRLYCSPSRRMADPGDVPGDERFGQRVL